MDSNSASTNVYRIEPLKGLEHYPVWKIQMTDVLTDQGLLEYANGDKVKPAQTEAEYSDWIKKDRSALSSIRLRVAGHNLVYVAGITESKPAWDALKNVSEPRGPIAMVLLHCKLFWAQWKEGGNIEEHVRTLRGYQQEYNLLSPTSPL